MWFHTCRFSTKTKKEDDNKRKFPACLGMKLLLSSIFLIQLIGFLCVSSEYRTRNTIDELKSWIISNGGYVHPLLDFQITKYGGITGIWLDDDPAHSSIKNNNKTTIFLVPEKCILCTKEEKRAEHLTALLLIEKLKGNESFFKPYFNSLPNNVDLPWEWNDEEIKQLNSNYMTLRIKKYKEKNEEKYKLFVQQYPSLANQTTKEEFIYYYKLALTRAFRVTRPVTMGCMVPLADFPNHDYRENVTWQIIEENEVNLFEFQHRNIQIKRGNEYRIRYTSLYNEDSLLGYGFSSLDPEYTTDMKIKMSEMAPKSSIKKQKRFPETILSVFDPPDGKFVRFFRVLAASDKTYELAEKSSYHVKDFFNHPTSRKKEILAFRTCIKTLNNVINLNETLYLENRNLMESSLTARERFTLFYRLSNERVFQKYLKFCKRMLQFTTCSTGRGITKIWVFNRSSSDLPEKIGNLTRNLWRNEQELCR